MPKEPKYKKAIPNLYKKGYIETSLFSWVNAYRYMFPDISIEKAILSFYKYYGIDEEDYPFTTAKQTYQRMNKELLKGNGEKH